ncbi:OmpH family outer membrane protein [Humisphaera borealis]|uniref:OmpH family outer membrane protein n=1 Tax=Humisphaera borealis TaxID=2807512 RepID=A0A7M2WZ52_9BACT|nr:OmpH family outer membrane protein [Humisphaera borealis]QOV90131.1 OmpH family outer membrane protein [Humisphaera borealis]
MAVSALVLTPSGAQAQSTVRVAVVNPAKVFNDAAETQALKKKFEEDQKRIQAEGTGKVEELKRLKAGRDEFRQGTDQWKAANDKLIRATADFKVWQQSEQIRAEWNQKDQMRSMFDKITQTVAKVAQRDGIDLVIADIGAKLPEDLDGVNMAQLNDAILKKTVLFVSAKQGLDITAAVQLQLDADYKSGGPPAAMVNPVAPK